MTQKNEKFELSGINHLALVCKDMARTVDFYTNVLGMPLVKTIDLPMGMGQHFFFDCGGGDCVAFFWFPDAPPAAPGIASMHEDIAKNGAMTAHASMNHLAISIPVGLPRASFSITPPGGSGVSLLIPSTSSAARLRSARA